MMNPSSQGDREFEEGARAALAAHQAAEIARQYQQGFGRPIISTEFKGFRVVAVGRTVKWSRNWRFFTDFLIDHLKDVIGRPWAIQAQREKKAHPIFEWLGTMKVLSDANKASGKGVIESRGGGHLGALWRLGYALYLIEHHDQMDEKLVRRIRNTSSFLAGYHEALVASAFAISGYEIRMAELVASDRPTPEFWATSPKGTRFAVEAKCKNGWKQDFADEEAFFSELRQWIRDQIYRCSRKKLPNAVYFLELGLLEDVDEAKWMKIYKFAEECINECSDMTVKNAPVVPAYVIITNNVDVLSNEHFNSRRAMMLFGFKLEKWVPNGAEVDIELAFDARDEHHEIHHVLKCFNEIDELPQTFDGAPIYFDDAGNELPFDVKVGTRIGYPDDNGEDREGLVLDICSAGEIAYLIVESDGKRHIVTMPLRPHEMDAAQKYGDSVFGKPEKKRENLEGDFLKFYDCDVTP